MSFIGNGETNFGSAEEWDLALEILRERNEQLRIEDEQRPETD